MNSAAAAVANDGQCTLREAITAANTNSASGGRPGECVAGAAGLDNVNFNIPRAGVHTITAATALPTFDSNGTSLGRNDNWRSDQKAAIIATGVPPSDHLESAIVAALPAGAYTAVVSGVNGASGIGVVEIYALE